MPGSEARAARATDLTRRRSERAAAGYSLIEVLAAIGLMGGVIVVIAGLLAVGARSVQSGRHQTTATALGKTVMEDVLAWSFDRTWEQTGGAGSDTSASWSTAQANPAFSGSADAAELAATCDEWRETVSELPNGVLLYQVDGIEAVPAGGSDGLTAFTEARLLRVSVLITWTESGGRARSAQFEEWKL